MERRVSMSRQLMIAILATVLIAAPIRADADHVLVLVTNKNGPLQSLRPIEIRKLYLGFTVANDRERPIRPISNMSDARLWNIFLQDVMGMSESSYRHRLLTLTLQSGRNRPEIIEVRELLLDRVEHDPDAITFAWLEDLEDRPNLRVLRVLWQD